MKKLLFLVILFVVFGFFSVNDAKAGVGDNVSGFAWSENIGWISFNNTSGGGLTNYGVNIDAFGNFSGYAWAENIGWISFNPSELTGCPSGTCEARVNLSNGEVSGWARALAYGGGWDGWIKLTGSNYGVSINKDTGNFSGYAWSDIVVGWINFSGVTYKVKTTFSFNQPPTAAMSCNAAQCSGGSCDGSWIAYQPIADPSPCIYTINNNSTDADGPADIVLSRWYIKVAGQPDSSYQLKLSCVGLCNYTFQSDVGAGDYVLKLYVEDTKGASGSVTHNLTIKSEVIAGFMCSLNNSTWQACENLSGKVSQNQFIYFKDDPSLAEYSVASQGASITSREWKMNGNVFGGNVQNSSTTLTQTINTVRLTVTDSAGRTDYQEHIISATPPLPEYKEVPPIIWLKKLLAAIVDFFDGF